MQVCEYIPLAVRTESGSDKPMEVRLTHAALGLCSEFSEFVAHTDHTNIVEELGDITWYAAIGLHAILNRPIDLTTPVPAHVKNLSDAVGEMANQVKRTVFYKKPANESLFYALLTFIFKEVEQIAQNHEVSLSTVLKANISKLRNRYPDKFDAERVDLRDAKAEAGIIADTVKEGA